MNNETLVPRIRSSSSTKGKDAIYDPRVDMSLPSIEYSNEEEDNFNNTSN